MVISNEQWKAIPLKLGLFENVDFIYNDYLIEVVPKIHKNKVVYVIFINGRINSEWLLKDNEMYPLVDKLWFKTSRNAYSMKDRKIYQRVLGKKEVNKKIFLLNPYFSSINTLIRQFKKLDGLILKED